MKKNELFSVSGKFIRQMRKMSIVVFSFIVIFLGCNQENQEEKIVTNESSLSRIPTDIDSVLYGKLVKDSLFIKLCVKFGELQEELMQDPNNLEAKKTSLDVLRLSIQNNAKRFECENLVPYIRKYNDENSQVLSRSVANTWEYVFWEESDYIEHWQETWSFYTNIHQIDCDQGNIAADIYYLLLRIHHNGDPVSFAAYLYKICLGLPQYVLMSYSYQHLNDIAIGTGCSLKLAIIDLYNTFYDYYTSGYWKKYVKPSENECPNCGCDPCICRWRCSVCGQLPCICGQKCPVCKYYPCRCFYEEFDLRNYEGKLDFSDIEAAYYVFHDEFPFEKSYKVFDSYLENKNDQLVWKVEFDLDDIWLSPISSLEDLKEDDANGILRRRGEWVSDHLLGNNEHYLLNYMEDIALSGKVMEKHCYYYFMFFAANCYVISTKFSSGEFYEQADNYLSDESNTRNSWRNIFDEERSKIERIPNVNEDNVIPFTFVAFLKRLDPKVKLLYFDFNSDHTINDYSALDITTSPKDATKYKLLKIYRSNIFD